VFFFFLHQANHLIKINHPEIIYCIPRLSRNIRYRERENAVTGYGSSRFSPLAKAFGLASAVNKLVNS
jgi:hypothetical protein